MDPNDGELGGEDNGSPLNRKDTKKKQKRKRGKTSLTLGTGKGKKSKHELEFNLKGQPAGKSRILTSSEAGKICRSHAPINCKSWRHVPKSVKEKMLEVIQDNYYCNKTENWQNRIMRKVGNQYRDFKHDLYNHYILPHRKSPHNIRKDPPENTTITLDEWTDFVAVRTSKAWGKVRKQAQERLARNIYNHRLSRKGYAGLEEEIQRKENTTKPIKRHILWKEGRKCKDGSYGDDLTKEKDKISAEVDAGTVTVEGSNDVLTQALGTQEYSGHVRGLVAWSIRRSSSRHPILAV